MTNNLTIEEIKSLLLSGNILNIKTALDILEKDTVKTKLLITELVLIYFQLLTDYNSFKFVGNSEINYPGNQLDQVTALLHKDASSVLIKIIEDNIDLFDSPKDEFRRSILDYEKYVSLKISEFSSTGEVDGVKFAYYIISNQDKLFTQHSLWYNMENEPGTTYLIGKWRKTKDNSILKQLLNREYKLNFLDLNLIQEEFEMLLLYISSFENIDAIEFLNFDSNQIEYLPKEIGKFQNLKGLSLQNNRIKELSEEIGALNKLQELIISDNQLQQLPSCIAHLHNLKMLFVDNNKLIALPEEMGQLEKLTNLYLGNNQLEKLPYSIKKLVNLKILDIKNNLLNNEQINQIKTWFPTCEIWI